MDTSEWASRFDFEVLQDLSYVFGVRDSFVSSSRTLTSIMEQRRVLLLSDYTIAAVAHRGSERLHSSPLLLPLEQIIKPGV